MEEEKKIVNQVSRDFSTYFGSGESIVGIVGMYSSQACNIYVLRHDFFLLDMFCIAERYRE